MSGTAPNDPAPGGHSKTFEQTSLDSNQHGQAQQVILRSLVQFCRLTSLRNIIDETKDTSGRIVDANLGESIDAAHSKGTSHRVDDILNQPGSGTGSTGAQKKATVVDENGFKVGEEADMHNLAGSKQP